MGEVGEASPLTLDIWSIKDTPVSAEDVYKSLSLRQQFFLCLYIFIPFFLYGFLLWDFFPLWGVFSAVKMRPSVLPQHAAHDCQSYFPSR